MRARRTQYARGFHEVPALTKADLHERVVAAVGATATRTPLDEVPLLVTVPGLVPLAVWAFTITSPPGGRHPTESKIQIMVPGQGRDERGDFEGPPDHYKLLVGVHPDDDMFVLWDAYKHRDFAFSKNVQVKGQLMWEASISGIATTTRNLANSVETVIAARGDHLVEAIRLRTRTQ
jgi:hypothetical protein